MSNDTPDNNPSIGDAINAAAAGVTASATSGVESVARATEPIVHSVEQNVGAAGRSYVSAGRELAVTFADVDAMNLAILDLNRFVVPLIGTVASIPIDPDLVASLVLSPVTGANAEAAALGAAARLTANLVVTEGLALIAGNIVSTYQLADSTLSAAAATLRADIGILGSAAAGAPSVNASALIAGAHNAGSALEGLGKIAVIYDEATSAAENLVLVAIGLAAAGAAALVSGVLTEYGESVGEAAGKTLADNPWNVAAFGTQVVQNFSPSDAWANSLENLQGILGATGPLYDDMLSLLIHDGHTFGWFRDGQAHLGVPTVTEQAIEGANFTAASDSAAAIYGPDGRITVDLKNRILPSDVASLFAGSAQIDNVGQSDFADIRIIKSENGPDQTAYTVQIPSTQVWDFSASAAPNDVTSDLYAMRFGDQSALAHAVFDAMSKAGIATGPGAPPVMLTGFSLGGITAGAIAADPHGYNIQQVVTAGAPIGGMDIPSTTHVTAFEARQDAVPSLDGTANPSSWTTIHQNAYRLANEATPYTSTPMNAHLANRYAVMAKENPAVNNDPAIGKFFQGTLTVTDHYATR